MPTVESQPAGRTTKIILTVLLLVFAAILLFARLSHYALWDDEAYTALSAQGVWQTGDTTAVLGHNIVALRQGTVLKHLRDRFQPPLPAYMAAPFVGWLGNTSLAPRLPFAFCGLLCIGLIVRWLWRANVSNATWLVTTVAVLCNVSFFLYCRQARYYAPAILLTTAIAYVYVFWDGRRRRDLYLIAILLVLLMATNLLIFTALLPCAVADYFLFNRRKLSRVDLLALTLPVVVLGGLMLSIWNPFGLDPFRYRPEHPVLEHFTLLWWNWRDLNRCEFGVGLLILLSPFLYFRRSQPMLLRATMTLAVFVVAISVLSPQPVGATDRADVRYLIPAIPLCIAIGVMSILTLTRSRLALALPLAAIAFGSNLFQADFAGTEPARSTPMLFAKELIHPPSDPYTVASRWISQHVAVNESIWVAPDFMAYPLMYHQPKVVYAWQLPDPADAQFAHLPDIHFLGRIPPDYVITFGRSGPSGKPHTLIHGTPYARVEILDFYGYPQYRPELICRMFEAYTTFDHELDAISIYKRQDGVATVKAAP